MLDFAVGAFMPAMLLALFLTPLARRAAAWADLVAPVRPDRLHREARPYGGGMAIMAVLVLAALAVRLTYGPAFDFVYLDKTFPGWCGPFVRPLLSFVFVMGHWAIRGLAIGAILFFVVGLMDDRFVLPAWLKLFLQSVAAAIMVLGCGAKATVWLAWPGAPEVVSILWFLAVVNAYNMLDHADGLASVTGLVALLALAAGMLLTRGWYDEGPEFIAGVALVTAGALGGFLFFNFPPARLFLGDAGSMLVGYLLAVLTIQAQYYHEGQTPSRLVVLIPLAILAVPLFDMVCVVAARLWRRQNPMKGDAASHLAHRMLARGWSPRGIVAFAAGATAVTGAASVSMYFLSGPALAAPWLVVAAVLAAMLLVRRPLHAEAAR
jgi:UDP-GlcNAc:undecaprenyl-phosphate GlcNAc-1-phosphate transferase